MGWAKVPSGTEAGVWNSVQLCDLYFFSSCPYPEFPGNKKFPGILCRISFQWTSGDDSIFRSVYRLHVHPADTDRKWVKVDEDTSSRN